MQRSPELSSSSQENCYFAISTVKFCGKICDFFFKSIIGRCAVWAEDVILFSHWQSAIDVSNNEQFHASFFSHNSIKSGMMIKKNSFFYRYSRNNYTRKWRLSSLTALHNLAIIKVLKYRKITLIKLIKVDYSVLAPNYYVRLLYFFSV